MDEIGDLTPYQLRNVYFMSDKEGDDISWYAKTKDACYKLWMDVKGKTKEEADELWREYSAKLLDQEKNASSSDSTDKKAREIMG